MKNQIAQIALKLDTDIAVTRSVSTTTLILRDSNVSPVSQPRIRLRRNFNLELNTRIKSRHSELARLSKLARIGQLFKLARIGQIFKTADVALSSIASSSIVDVYSPICFC